MNEWLLRILIFPESVRKFLENSGSCFFFGCLSPFPSQGKYCIATRKISVMTVIMTMAFHSRQPLIYLKEGGEEALVLCAA